MNDKNEDEAQDVLRQRAQRIVRGLKRAYPEARCELDFTTPLELAIGCILSAQCTDVRVNSLTPGLFAKYRSAADWAAVPAAVLEEEIRSTGFFRNKTKSILGLCQALVERHGGEVPDDFDTLVGLPGIGRKTANVLMVSAFGRPGIVVDTHMTRLANRMGFTRQRHPDKIEFDLQKIVPQRQWGLFSHVMVWHGRRCCTARRPACHRCVVRRACPSRDQFGAAAKRGADD
jgi:endonuclease III